VTLFLLIALLNTSTKHACSVSNQFYEINVPIAPAISSTEVVKTAAVFGGSKTMLGSTLTLRNGKRYFADPATQQHRSHESYELLRELGVQHPEDTYAGTLWPVTKPVPRSFLVVSCK
jgi:hypothetical protein